MVSDIHDNVFRGKYTGVCIYFEMHQKMRWIGPGLVAQFIRLTTKPTYQKVEDLIPLGGTYKHQPMKE